MNILFHVGVGNHNRPERWNGICWIYTQLAKSFESIGHTCTLYVHPKAVRDDIFHRFWTDSEVNISIGVVQEFDVCFTWNGTSEGDKKIIGLFGRSNCVFGELGFFDHYSTTYFDFSGTNARTQNLLDEMEENYDEDLYNNLVDMYKKPPARTDKYIFVAMQDEQDTNITQFSPFSTMNELLEWVCDLTSCYGDDVKVLYKMHPRAPCKITVQNPKLEQVFGNVHEYMPNAKCVIGINSTVLFECLLYHNRIITAGLGLSSRPIRDDRDRKRYVIHCYKKQIHQNHLGDPNHIKETWMYKTLMEKYNERT